MREIIDFQAVVAEIAGMKRLLAIVFILLFWGCGVKVETSYDPTVDFSNYDSFCWLQGCEFAYQGPSYLDDSLVREYIKVSLIQVMEEKGIRYDPDGDPDLLLDFHITAKREDYVHFQGKDDYDAIHLEPFPQMTTVSMLKGTFVIDIVDKTRGSMIWRSQAVKYMEIYPDITEENFVKGIELALKDFPPVGS